MDVSVIIVNYNTKQLLSDCLTTIYEHTRGLDFEVIVVDNASSDGSEEYVTSQFTQVKWISSDGNIGFGRANNLGASHAKGKYLFLLNSDTLLLNNAIKEFYEYAEANDDGHLGVLGCWLLDNDKNLNHSFGLFPSPLSETQQLVRRLLNKRVVKSTDIIDVEYITGADMFLRREVFDFIGGFDPNFFMYYEETDLQYRLAKAGYFRRIIPNPQIIHLEGGSFAKRGLTFKRFMVSQRSCLYYIRKHYSGFYYILYRFYLCLIRLPVFVVRGWTIKERFVGYLSCFSSWREGIVKTVKS